MKYVASVGKFGAEALPVFASTTRPQRSYWDGAVPAVRPSIIQKAFSAPRASDFSSFQPFGRHFITQTSALYYDGDGPGKSFRGYSRKTATSDANPAAGRRNDQGGRSRFVHCL